MFIKSIKSSVVVACGTILSIVVVLSGTNANANTWTPDPIVTPTGTPDPTVTPTGAPEPSPTPIICWPEPSVTPTPMTIPIHR